MGHEMDGAISGLKPHSAAGPDKMLPIILTQAGPKLREALLAPYQACWSKGSLPSILKEENRIFLTKELQENYPNPKSYRSINLTSTVGKTFECVMDSKHGLKNCECWTVCSMPTGKITISHKLFSITHYKQQRV